MYLYIHIQGVRAASHVHLVVAELCCRTPCQLRAGKTQRQSWVKSSAIVKSCHSLVTVLKRFYLLYIAIRPFYLGHFIFKDII